MEEFLDQIDSINFYIFAALRLQKLGFGKITEGRFAAKLLFLPVIQIMVPTIILISAYGMEDEDEVEIGLCPNDPNMLHRFVGMAFMVYSMWQTIDGLTDGASTAIIKQSCRHYEITGIRPRIRYFIGYIVHVVVSLVCIVTLYFTMASSTSVMSLAMNCYGISFLLAIDTEWVGPNMTDRGMQWCKWKFRQWRDIAITDPELVKESIQSNSILRKRAVRTFNRFHASCVYMVSFTGYALALFFFGCDAAW